MGSLVWARRGHDFLTETTTWKPSHDKELVVPVPERKKGQVGVGRLCPHLRWPPVQTVALLQRLGAGCTNMAVTEVISVTDLDFDESPNLTVHLVSLVSGLGRK